MELSGDDNQVMTTREGAIRWKKVMISALLTFSHTRFVSLVNFVCFVRMQSGMYSETLELIFFQKTSLIFKVLQDFYGEK